MHVRWGGTTEGYDAHIVAETSYEWVGVKPDGRATILDRHSRDHTMFDTQADAEAHHAARQARWDAVQQDYDRQISAKRLARAQLLAGPAQGPR